jgi:hypothetical protein
MDMGFGRDIGACDEIFTEIALLYPPLLDRDVAA